MSRSFFSIYMCLSPIFLSISPIFLSICVSLSLYLSLPLSLSSFLSVSISLSFLPFKPLSHTLPPLLSPLLPTTCRNMYLVFGDQLLKTGYIARGSSWRRPPTLKLRPPSSLVLDPQIDATPPIPMHPSTNEKTSERQMSLPLRVDEIACRFGTTCRNWLASPRTTSTISRIANSTRSLWEER